MISIISGTNRPNSNSIKIAKHYQQLLAEKGETSEIVALTQLPDNIIATDLYGERSEAFKPIQARITATQKFIFVVPEYNGGFPGVLKVFMDACAFPESFSGKKAALVGISSGRYGNIRGIEHFTGVCNYCGLHILPLRLHIPHVTHDFDENGKLTKEDTLRFVNEQVDKFLVF